MKNQQRKRNRKERACVSSNSWFFYKVVNSCFWWPLFSCLNTLHSMGTVTYLKRLKAGSEHWYSETLSHCRCSSSVWLQKHNTSFGIHTILLLQSRRTGACLVPDLAWVAEVLLGEGRSLVVACPCCLSSGSALPLHAQFGCKNELAECSTVRKERLGKRSRPPKGLICVVCLQNGKRQ